MFDQVQCESLVETYLEGIDLPNKGNTEGNLITVILVRELSGIIFGEMQHILKRFLVGN